MFMTSWFPSSVLPVVVVCFLGGACSGSTGSRADAGAEGGTLGARDGAGASGGHGRRGRHGH